MLGHREEEDTGGMLDLCGFIKVGRQTGCWLIRCLFTKRAGRNSKK